MICHQYKLGHLAELVSDISPVSSELCNTWEEHVKIYSSFVAFLIEKRIIIVLIIVLMWPSFDFYFCNSRGFVLLLWFFPSISMCPALISETEQFLTANEMESSNFSFYWLFPPFILIKCKFYQEFLKERFFILGSYTLFEIKLTSIANSSVLCHHWSVIAACHINVCVN